jgi:tRNA pseudouridine38-40 synthase
LPRYKLTIAYDGTEFVGWQKQEPPATEHPGLPVLEHRSEDGRERVALRSVQHIVEQVVRETVREPVDVVGASRTDSGVHARGQVAAFTSRPDPERGVGWPAERGTDTLVRALNSRLPRDVLVSKAEIVDDGFNPIGGAVEKEYTYTIVAGPDRPLWDRSYVFHTWYELDGPRMKAAAAALVGEHDFAAFASVNHGRKSTVRTVFACHVSEQAGDTEKRFVIRVRGNGFLYNMVRIIAGTVMEAGRSSENGVPRITPEQIATALANSDRTLAGPTLPPQGLRLEWVRYG